MNFLHSFRNLKKEKKKKKEEEEEEEERDEVCRSYKKKNINTKIAIKS